MKKLLLTIFLLTCASSCFAAAPDLNIGTVAAFPGQAISIPVFADFSIPVGSIQFTLKYDPALLTIGTITVGSSNAGWTIVSNGNTPGTVIIGMFSTAGTTIGAADQQIAVVNFNVNANPGTSTIGSPNLILSSAVFDQNNITTLINGNFTLNLIGDVNGDGKVNLSDAVLIAQSCVGLSTLTANQQTIAEVDGKSAVDIYDALLIAEYVAGIITKP